MTSEGRMDKCGHHPCSCEVTEKIPFCSTLCADAAGAPGRHASCECPHDDCAGHEEID